MSILARFTNTSPTTTEQYDDAIKRLQSAGDFPPDGMEYHVCFVVDGNIRVSEIWDSEDDWRGFFEGELGAAFSEVGLDMPEPEIVQVQELWGSGLQPT